jgi:hypothetical protein
VFLHARQHIRRFDPPGRLDAEHGVPGASSSPDLDALQQIGIDELALVRGVTDGRNHADGF